MNKKYDSLGSRMKEFYENRSKTQLLRRSYSIIRIDGKAFHTYTRGLKQPFDLGLIEDMGLTTMELCTKIQGAKFAYVQSDEISILITDFDNLNTDMWFNGNVQKIVSVSASIATAKFNHLRLRRILSNTLIKDYVGTINNMKLAEFDSRVFQIPYSEEVVNYFIWRQKDAIRNSISSVAQSLYSPKELFGKKTNDMQEMILQKGINWDDFSSREKKGGIICKLDDNWVIPTEIPIFTQDKEFLKNLFNTNIE